MRISRRSLFRYSVDELVATVEESRGRRNFKLSDLGGLPTDQLAPLIPAIMDASSVRVCGDLVVADDGTRQKFLYSATSPDADVWPRIDGQTSLRDIATALAPAWDEEFDAAFARVRRVFLALVRHRISAPINALE